MRKKIFYTGLLLVSVSFFSLSCQKETTQTSLKEQRDAATSARKNNNSHGHLKQTKTFSSDVIVRWLNMQLDMLRVPLAPGTGAQAAERCQGYCGIAAYEAVVPGMPAYQSLSGQLTDFPQMPSTEPGKAYHWAASANAALAEMNRKLFPTTSDANKTSITNLENNLQAAYATEVDDATLQRSIAFGKEVAAKVVAWAATDGSANVNPAYVPPVGPGLWVPTAPTPAVNPYAYQRRLLVPAAANGTALEPPPSYSTVPGSPFWEMVKEVYDKSLVLTPDQMAMAIYHRDAPGYPGGGHFIAILSQALAKAHPSLDIAALGYAKVGLGQHDATMICFKNKYNYKLVRPITYIRDVMGHTNWSPLIPTPNHPEFPSGHAVINASVMEMLTDGFGDNFQLTLHTYDYLGLPARSYNSFYEMGKEMANSRVFGGIHYQATCDKSSLQGKKVAKNILNKIKFHK
ncbi:MAG TPA: vanadium-dependent haloperoxidase [Chitinophagaceae bacterium]|nr:vanadium-dependent haloperoxidase [Chitinophagaceae bacterium]